MGKILLFASIALTGATAALGFLNRGKLAETRTTLESTSAELTQSKTDLTKTQGDLKTSTENLAAVTAEKDQATAQLTEAQAAAAKAKADLETASGKVTAQETQIAQLEADIKEKTEQLTALAANPTDTTQAAQTPEQQAKIQELETVNAKLQTDLDASRSQLEELRKAEQDRQALKMRNGLEGRILAVNQAWNFVVLNLGDKNGVVSNAEMLVKRGNQLIGKIRVTTVDPTSAIADIVANSVPAGTTISPGDNVIYQAVEE